MESELIAIGVVLLVVAAVLLVASNIPRLRHASRPS